MAEKIKKPTLASDEAVRRAESAHQHAIEDRRAIEPRLAAGLIDGVPADIALVRGILDSTLVVRTATKSLTAKQNAQAGDLAGLVSLVRAAIFRKFPGNKTLTRKFGVGEKVTTGKVSSVTGGAEKVLAAAEKHPAETAQAAVLQSDLKELRGLLAALTTTDSVQEKSKADSKRATASRNAAVLRLQEAVKDISFAGQLAFRKSNPARAKIYADLIKGVSKARKTPPPANP